MEINATLIVQIIIFLLLQVWLSRFLFKPFLKLFDAREQAIEGARLETDELQKAVHQKLELVEDKIRQAQKEARQILLDLKAEGILYQRSILDAARKEAKQKLQVAQENLAKQIENAKAELFLEIPTLSRLAVNRILQSESSAGMSSHFDKMESRSA